jgi:helix-turn-helix, Psq domain
MVRRIRLSHGHDAERGRRLELNGSGSLGVQLIANGLSVRAASMLSGVPRSTLHDRARRGR